ncbi:FUSC family protein [Luteibacter anthropi]|uniref:FUSC family protein n=1 Tax=Luteibacter anthropi TaxID=564369 RepID=UPI0020330B9B|nr:FUSC family protein [Luteibacter anthropi]URX63386.1 FUSC family protein [Luteibacter anthropi]
MSPPDPKTPRSDAIRILRLRRAQRLLDHLFRDLPLRRRARLGLFMAFKTMASAGLAYGVGWLAHPGQAYWAAISAIAVTQPHFGDTRGAGHDRVLGTLFGAVAGLLGLWVGGTGDLFSFLLALCLVTVACWLAGAGAAARVGGITSAIVLLVPAEGPRWEMAAWRLGEVLFGTLCALAIGWLVSRLEERVERKEEDQA